MLGARVPKRPQRTRLDLQPYDDRTWLGRSPTARDLEELSRKAGFRSILNLNTEGEPEQVLSPNVEATWAHTFELHHERVSIDPDCLRPEHADRFLEALARIEPPIYVHSLLGRRARAMLALHLALESGLSGEAALARAEALGLDCGAGPLRGFLLSELDRRVPGPTPVVQPEPGGESSVEGPPRAADPASVSRAPST